MAPITYTGALQPKKKSELQEIALALRISDQGTKDELQARIKKHLDNNISALEDDPQFAGLYGRRRRSVQPQLAPPPTTNSEKPRSSHRIAALGPIRETTPVKQPPSPAESKSPTPVSHISPRHAAYAEPIPPAPDSPSPPAESPVKSIVQAIPKADEVIATLSAVQRRVVQQTQQEIIPHGTEFLQATRTFLSNSRNIWSITSLFEALYIVSYVVPWKYAALPLTPKGDSSALAIPYPPLSTFQTSAFWLVLLHWAIPTLIAPALVGNLISFNPASTRASSKPREPSANKKSPADTPFDPLTAAIVRLAAAIAYPYGSFASSEQVYGLDVLGYNMRVFNASVGLAFAFAEAIQGAPRVFAKTLAKEQRKAIQGISISRGATPVRALIGEAGETPEVD